MVPPSPELLRRFRNTDGLVMSNRSYLIPDMVNKYPHDYLDMTTYESMKRFIQR
jgi:hypothetical protein